MKTVRLLGRVLVPASLVLLAACQSLPGSKSTTAQSTAPETTAAAPGQKASQEGAVVAIFLADTVAQTGWTSVQIPSGALYVNPQPILTRGDFTGVKAGTNKQGEGLLALDLNEGGKKKVVDVTTQNPNKRLALVVGHTMLAAPGYSTPVTSSQLVFAVGTEQNATAAARAIAGVDQSAPAAPAK
jgi:preprotein translocase subunit SecD